MRVLATFCFAFAAGVFGAQYLLPAWLLPYAAAGFAVLGALWAAALWKNWRRRVLLVAAGLSLALLYDYACVRIVQQPFEALFGATETLTLELAGYPTATDYGSRAEVRILNRSLRGKAVYYGGTGLLDLEPGARLTARAEVRSAATIRESEVTTFTARGVFALLYARGEAEMKPGGAATPLRYLPQRLAHRMQETVAAAFPERTAPFLRAILLGDRYELSEEDAAYLSEAGLYHVTAVSGLHCAFLVSLLGFLTGRRREKLLSAAAIPLLALYALTVGLTPSVVRACVMLAMTLIAPLFDRENDGPTSLSFALFLILLRNPFAAKSVSLQLSFAAMAGLVWLTPRLHEAVRARRNGRRMGRAARFVVASLCATAGALVFTAPLSAHYFNILTLVTPLSNLLCLWAASLTFASGLVTVLLGFLCLPAARLAAYLPHGGALYLLTAAKWLAKLPYHAVYFSNNYLTLWLAYVYALFAVCGFARRGRLRYAMASLLAAAALALTLWLNAAPMRDGALHIVALDVGQGQSVALLSKGSAALIDCGSSSYGSAGGVTADYLRSVGVDTLDCVVISHYHDDHCNGLPALFARCKVAQLVLPDIGVGDELRASVLALAERYGVRVTFVRETEKIALGDAVLTVYPPVAQGETNEEGLTALCSVGSFDVLFTGDMDTNTEYRLIAAYPLPDIEVLMVGHHGSRYSTGGGLLAEVKPETGVVSCGAGNSYGHPHKETLQRLADANVEVYRTDRQGNIHITVNGRALGREYGEDSA